MMSRFVTSLSTRSMRFIARLASFPMAEEPGAYELAPAPPACEAPPPPAMLPPCAHQGEDRQRKGSSSHAARPGPSAVAE